MEETEHNFFDQKSYSANFCGDNLDQNGAVKLIIEVNTGRIVDASQAACIFYGYKREELVSMHINDINMLPQKEILNILQSTFDGDVRRFGFKHRLANGEIRDVEVFCGLMHSSEKSLVFSVVFDVTEKLKKELELRESEARFRTSLEAINDVLWDWNAETDELYLSDAWKNMLGYASDEFNLTSVEWDKCIHPEDKELVHEKLKQHFEGIAPIYRCEYRVLCKDETYKWILDRGKVISRTAEGKPRRVVGTYVDINERKQMQEQLKLAKEQAEAASIAKSQFLANMSHEIRTPLNCIIGFLDLLNSKTIDSEKLDYINEAKIASNSLRELINNVLDFSKIEAGKMTLAASPMAIEDVIKEAMTLFSSTASSKGLDLFIEISKAVPAMLIGDSLRLKQVLYNLISNAVKFTDQGSVSIAVECLKLEKEEASLRFTIKDTGIGMEERYMKNLFEPFTQADQSISKKYEGTGLGLAISKRILDAMNAYIEVKSRVGVGTSFSFVLNLARYSHTNSFVERDRLFKEAEALKSAVARIREQVPVNQEAEKLLLVEDHQVNQKLAVKMLARAGFKCDCASNGIEAIEMTSKGKYGLILMDCQMPEMDGYSTTKYIRKHEKAGEHVPIIALTANAQPDDMQCCLDAGMDDYLSKPIDFTILVDKIKQHMGNSKPNTAEIEDNELKQSLDRLVSEVGFTRDEAQVVLSEYIRDTLEITLSNIIRAIEFREKSDLKKLIHSLKGASTNMGLKKVSVICKKLEDACDSEDFCKCSSIAASIKTSFINMQNGLMRI